MVNKHKISLVIPCKNEAGIIASLIKKIPSYVNDIIVVDNNSQDATASVAKKAGAKVYRELRTVNGIGYGFAHHTGIKHAKGDIIIGLDGDDTYPVRSIKKIVAFMDKNGFDVLACNRLPLKNNQAISATRRLGIQLLNLETRLLFGYPINDILTGMWAIRATALPYLNLTEGGWDLSPEVKIKAIISPHLRFGEYHIDHFYRDDSTVSKQKIWQTGFNHFKYIFLLRLKTLAIVEQIRYPRCPIVIAPDHD